MSSQFPAKQAINKPEDDQKHALIETAVPLSIKNMSRASVVDVPALQRSTQEIPDESHLTRTSNPRRHALIATDENPMAWEDYAANSNQQSGPTSTQAGNRTVSVEAALQPPASSSPRNLLRKGMEFAKQFVGRVFRRRRK